jgi:hypothetical protein
MSITPRGMSVQEAYRLYRDDKLIVNRKYQRKLVWTIDEKQRLIDSILNDYPIPLILFAEMASGGNSFYEIIDGMQRLNAIFAYIEHEFSVQENYFDISQFARAKQAAEAGLYEAMKEAPLLAPSLCADFLDYQLAVTIFPSVSEEQVTEVFGRINSGGRQLSWQEKRQAGRVNEFSSLIRRLASEIRGDASRDILSLSEMPEISIDTVRRGLGYSLLAEEIFWCKQGILWTKQLRESEDEETLADICASILSSEPIARSRELLDEIYNDKSLEHAEIIRKLHSYGIERLYEEIKVTLSVLKEVIEAHNSQANALRSAINPGSSNPIKASFFSLFMAFHNLVIVEEKTPSEPNKIMGAIEGLQRDMISTAKYSKTEDRIKNIDKTKGLIQRYFVKKDPPMLRHGAGLALDFENAMRRSKIESGRYECKQGFVSLDHQRKLDKSLDNKLLETICAIANVGPDSDGFIFIGVADKEADALRIAQLDNVNTVSIGNRFVVGVDRELKVLSMDLDAYVRRIAGFISTSDLSPTLKHQVSAQIDIVEYKGLSVIRLRVPPQTEVSFLGEKAFIRENANTTEATGKKLLAVNGLFA